MIRTGLKMAIAVLLIVGFCSMVWAETPAPKDERKHTTLGKYATSIEAYEMWKANPTKVKIIDCRIPEEYAYVGHAPMAINIPSMVWTGKWNAEKNDYALDPNTEFEALVKQKAALDDTILIMCRSGHRSSASVNRLAKVGFTNVYNIVDGFEGDMVTDEDSYFKGKRGKNGWKNSSAPWTYQLDPALIYRHAEK
jgi:rhodanese-related sulfurtransferase